MYPEEGTGMVRSPEPLSGNTCRNQGYLAGGEHWRESKIPVLDKLKPSHEEGMTFVCAAKLEQWVKVAKSYSSFQFCRRKE